MIPDAKNDLDDQLSTQEKKAGAPCAQLAKFM